MSLKIREQSVGRAAATDTPGSWRGSRPALDSCSEIRNKQSPGKERKCSPDRCVRTRAWKRTFAFKSEKAEKWFCQPLPGNVVRTHVLSWEAAGHTPASSGLGTVRSADTREGALNHTLQAQLSAAVLGSCVEAIAKPLEMRERAT